MTGSTKDPDLRQEPALGALVADALAEDGQLIPTTESEVARAEAAGVAFEGALPEGLREFGAASRASADVEGRASSAQAPSGESSPDDEVASRRVVPLEQTRAAHRGRLWLSHLAAGVVGAAAATTLWLWRTEPGVPSTGTAAQEPVDGAGDATRPEPKISLARVADCPKDCCAGRQCASPRETLEVCSSGRACVACSFETLAASRYRIRVGPLAATPAGDRARERAGGSLDMCIRVGSSDFACVPSHRNRDRHEQWADLGLVATAEDLLAGFELELVSPGDRTVLGKWRQPVRINSKLLCKGLALKPVSEAGEALGRVSVFLVDTYYVELMRSDRVPALLEHEKRFEFSGLSPAIFETTGRGTARFALGLGPMSQAAAESLRWQVLSKGGEARVVIGADYVGEPRHVNQPNPAVERKAIDE